MSTPPPKLTTTSRVRALAPDPPATVQIRNLATVLQRAGRDAWGRAGKAQPARLSAEVAFAAGFAAAAAGDALGAGDTVHYGVLSKAVLACVARFEAQQRQQQQQQQQQRGEGEVILAGGEGQEEGLGQAREGTVRELLQALWAELTGLGLDGGEPRKEAFLDLGKVRLLSVAVALPKASLLGEGVSLTASAVFEEGTGRMEARAVALEISRLRVPTLVGVNANERLAKQFVLTTVTIDGFDGAEDAYTEIEAVVVKAQEESSFQTLEALGAHLAERVLTSRPSRESWQVCIRMEKPTAVPLADCPIVEVRATAESLRREKAAAEPKVWH